MGWLDRGEAPEPDADAPVEVEDVWLNEGPMLLRVLEQAGIQPHGLESFNLPAEATNRMRILVRYADAPRAVEVLADHRRRMRDG